MVQNPSLGFVDRVDLAGRNCVVNSVCQGDVVTTRRRLGVEGWLVDLAAPVFGTVIGHGESFSE